VSNSEIPHLPDETPPPTSTLSLASLMMGIIGWVLLPVVGGIIAVITGHMARREIRQSGGLLGGNGLASAGLILGYSNMALGLCGCFILLLFPALFAGVWSFGNQILNSTP
jgi:hypothetical protein